MKEDTNVGFVLNHVIAQQDLARLDPPLMDV